MLTSTLHYRPIEFPRDSARVITYYRDACRASFGDDDFERHLMPPGRYLSDLAERVEEYPDGHLLAYDGVKCVGHLEMQVPYGLTTGYLSLFYVAPPRRRLGYGRALHARAEQYFRSWEANRIELHVSPANEAALAFYRAMGYHVAREEGDMWRMAKTI